MLETVIISPLLSLNNPLTSKIDSPGAAVVALLTEAIGTPFIFKAITAVELAVGVAITWTSIKYVPEHTTVIVEPTKLLQLTCPNLTIELGAKTWDILFVID